MGDREELVSQITRMVLAIPHPNRASVRSQLLMLANSIEGQIADWLRHRAEELLNDDRAMASALVDAATAIEDGAVWEGD